MRCWPHISPHITDSSLSFNLMGMYEQMGNTISLQYGGSEAHSVFFDRKKGEWEATTQSKVWQSGDLARGDNWTAILLCLLSSTLFIPCPLTLRTS